MHHESTVACINITTTFLGPAVLTNSQCDLELFLTLHNSFFPLEPRLMGNTHKPIVYGTAANVAESKNAGGISMKTKKCCPMTTQCTANLHTVTCSWIMSVWFVVYFIMLWCVWYAQHIIAIYFFTDTWHNSKTGCWLVKLYTR